MPGLHHYHRRQRAQRRDPSQRLIPILDRVIYAVGVIGPVMTLPQVYTIWVLQQAEGVSVLTWASYVVTNFFWIAYGVVHREKPIILTYCLWVVVNGAVALGAMLYG